MTKIAGFYFDGVTSLAQEATLESVSDGFLVETKDGQRHTFEKSSTRFLAKIGSTVPALEFNRFARFQSNDTALDSLKVELGGHDYAHQLESRWKIALSSLVIVLTLVVLFYRVALPAIAKNLAFRMP
jgi:hypothetical protein